MDELMVSQLLRAMARAEANRIIFAARIDRQLVFDTPVSFTPSEIAKLIPPLLAVARLSNKQLARLLAESEIGADLVQYHPPQSVIVSVPYAMGPADGNGIPISELAAATVIIWETAARVAAVLDGIHDLKARLPPPRVSVYESSVGFSFGGGTLIAAGVGFIVAAAAGMIPAVGVNAAQYGGAFLSSVGVIDMAISWVRTVAEAEKLTAEAAKLAIEAEKLGSESKLNEVKVVQTQLEIDTKRAELAPASSLVTPEVLTAELLRFGISRPLGSQLLNEVLPAYLELSRSHSNITASPARSATSGA
jgi:hypothetical protein